MGSKPPHSIGKLFWKARSYRSARPEVTMESAHIK